MILTEPLPRFVIIMIMMTCCGACSYVKKRQYYMRQQQALGADLARTGHVHHPPSMCVHPSNDPAGPPVGTFPGPPAYNEVSTRHVLIFFFFFTFDRE